MYATLHALVAATGLMIAAGPPLVPGTCLPPPLPPEAPAGYLWFVRADPQGLMCKLAEPYQPCEGDLVLFGAKSKLWTFLSALAHTGAPFHAAIVVKRPDGRLATLEAGPGDKLSVYLLDCVPRLQTYQGIINVRRCKQVLTAEQSCRLTAFALAQEGKRYAWFRLLLQMTPIKTRGGLWRHHLATTHFDRRRWFCSEIVVAAAELVGLMDANTIKATSTYPADLLDNRLFDLSATYEDFGYWSPRP